MVDCSDFAIVVDHICEVGGQKKLAKGVDGCWYIWKWLRGENPRTECFSSEVVAKLGYKTIDIEKTNVKYDATPVPHLVKINDKYWSELGR